MGYHTTTLRLAEGLEARVAHWDDWGADAGNDHLDDEGELFDVALYSTEDGEAVLCDYHADCRRRDGVGIEFLDVAGSMDECEDCLSEKAEERQMGFVPVSR